MRKQIVSFLLMLCISSGLLAGSLPVLAKGSEGVPRAQSGTHFLENSALALRDATGITISTSDDMEAYDLLDWQPMGSAYWNPLDGDFPTEPLTAAKKPSNTNYPFFVCSSRMFTREDIPVGSIIVIESGWQYRPDGWITLGVQSARPANVTASPVVVDEAWWGSYQYRAFNVAVAGGNIDISNRVEEVASYLKIYVPQEKQSDIRITNFWLGTAQGKINGDEITVDVPADTDLTAISPKITTTGDTTVSPGADEPQNFTQLVTYTATGGNGEEQSYTVKVRHRADSGDSDRTLKVLAIGNSFSEDATQHLYQIAQNAGAENVVIGHIYFGGCSLATHWGYASSNQPAYTYFKNTTGSWTTRTGQTMLTGILDEDWDYITLQQASAYSGLPDSYNSDLTNLINYINTNKTNPEAILAWHATWAYQADSPHTSFPWYDSNQTTMYNAIIAATEQRILTQTAIDIVIPTGTAVQNVRTSYIGDTLTRDGHHLSNNLGRYIAGVTWLRALTGWTIDDITYVPNTSEVPAHYLPLLKEAVNAAIDSPYGVTASTHTTDPTDFNKDDFDLLDWEPVGSAYWNSQDPLYPAELLTAEKKPANINYPYFIGSARMFTREDIPVGSVIEIDSGYQYRPDGWVTLGYQSTRPGNVTAARVFVDEAWWGDYHYRAFNVAVAGGSTDISNRVEEVAAKFRIYVPKTEDTPDLAALESLLAQAEGLLETGKAVYVPAAVKQALQSTVSEGQTMLTKAKQGEATAAQVTAAITALETAIDAFDAAPDKTALAQAIADASLLVANEYTPASWALLETALGSAKNVLQNEDATPTSVNESCTALLSAIDCLYTRLAEACDMLAAAISKAEASYFEEDYTAQSWKPLDEAISSARTLLGNEEAVLADVEAAHSALLSAIDGLYTRLAEARDKLAAAVSEAETSYARDDYTAQSWKVFSDAFEKAKILLESTDATLADIADAETALLRAVQGLIEIETKEPNPKPIPDPGPKPTPGPSAKVYKILEGGGATYTGHETGITLRSEGAFSKFKDVSVAGALLMPGTHFTVSEGSTVVVLLPAYLNTLANGTYALGIQFEDGISTTHIVIDVGPTGSATTGNINTGGAVVQTGGTENPLWYVLALISLVVCITCLVIRWKLFKRMYI